MSSSASPKYLQIAQLLEEEATAGRWNQGRTPSARAVANRHGVSVVTASRALQVLRDAGLIRTVDRSGSFLTTPTAALPERYAMVQRSTPGPWLEASLSFARSGFDAVAEHEGVRFEGGHFQLDLPGTDSDARLRHQAQVATDLGIRGVFLMPSRISVEAMRSDEALLDACRAVGLPVVLIERNLRGAFRSLDHDLAAADDLDGGLRCTEHLLQLGRRRVAFVAGSPTSSHEGRLAGYLAAIQRAGGRRDPLIVEQLMEQETRAAYQDLADRLIEMRADGVVCYQDYAAIGLVVELLTRGFRVPDDVAITGFDDLPIGKAFSIGVTTYAVPAATVATQALRLMRARIQDLAAQPVKSLIPGRLVIRESSRSA